MAPKGGKQRLLEELWKSVDKYYVYVINPKKHAQMYSYQTSTAIMYREESITYEGHLSCYFVATNSPH